MKKLNLLYLTFFLPLTSINAQHIPHTWAKAHGEIGSTITSVAGDVDSNNNLYVVGTLTGPQINIGGTTIFNQGQKDIVVIKYKPNGQVVWAKGFGGSQSDCVTDVKVDRNGEVILTGHHNSQDLMIDGIQLQSFGGNDIFVTKLDSLGNGIWAKGFTGNNNEGSGKIDLDSNNNIYILGDYVSSLLAFGNLHVSNVSGKNQLFLVKLDHSGNDLWAISSANAPSLFNYSYDLLVSSSDDIIITGRVYGDNYITFGNDTIFGNSDFNFAAKFNNSGNYLSSDVDLIWSGLISSDPLSNSLFVVHSDSIIKTLPSFQKIWKKKIYYPLTNFGLANSHSISIFEDNIYILGDYNREIFFETDSFITPTYNWQLSYSNIFLLNLDTSGNENWVRSYGGFLTDFGKDVIAYSNDDLYMLGHFESEQIHFDNFTLQNDNDSVVFHIHGSDSTFQRFSYLFATQLSDEPVNINEHRFADFKIYPNPTSSDINVFGKRKFNEIRILNTLGQIVYKEKNTRAKNEVKIDVSNYPSGLYFLSITNSDNEKSTSKVIIH